MHPAPSPTEMFQEVLESAPDAMLIVNPEGVIILLNRSAEEMFGYAREDLIGYGVELLVPKDAREAHARDRTLYQSQPRHRAMGVVGSIRGRRRDGSVFPADVSLGPLHREDGTYTVVAVRDLTAKRIAEQARERLLERVQDLERELDLLRARHVECPQCGAEVACH